ncbi:sensor domain-containing diguanylate cyclase [Demequina gelatinilytica]|uniref:sensor domain-containing diguanylate cyclase n=1 Tax=Demequina gelatinilytica TaxID=1638980 RepID=UPI000AFFBB42|nr:diguanylate cyclase [Demequina gelatinilytica]
MRRLSRRAMGGARSRSLVALVLVIAAFVGQLVVGIQTSLAMAHSASEAASDTYAYVGDLLTARVAQVRDSAEDLAATTAAAVELVGSSAEPGELTSLLLDRVRRATGVKAMMVVLADGRSYAVGSTDDGFVVRRFLDDGAGGLQGEHVFLDHSGARTAVPPRNVAFDDARTHAWYRTAVASDGSAWVTSDLPPALTGTAGGADGAAVVARTTSRRTAALVQFDIDALATILGEVPIGDEARAYVLGRDGTVIAASTHARIAVRLHETRLGHPVTARDLGLSMLAVNTSPAGEAVVRTDDGTVTFEQVIQEGGDASWVLVVEARADSLVPAVSRTAGVVLRVVTAALVLGLGALVAFRWLGADMGRLRHEASHDALTGLTDRQGHEAAVASLLGSRSEGRGVLAIAFDLDGFKRLNDTYGHAVGDAALVAAAKALRAAVREEDVVSRMGGDEFVCIMLVDEPERAWARVERVRVAIVSGLAADPDVPLGIGVTAGFAVDPDGRIPVGELQNAADAALVGGKARGKGRTYAASSATAARV